MGSITPLPYWQINVPPSLHTSFCPPFLQNLSPKDKAIISTPDSSYIPLSWEVVKNIIKRNDLAAFQRLPSDLRRYLEYIYSIKLSHGSVMRFILEERLGWGEGGLNGDGKKGFGNEDNWKILCNDWPYGVDERIVHLVVWTKFELEDDENGFLSKNARGMIEEFVGEKFVRVCGENNVRWLRDGER
jgi:hypothetical protein